MCNKSKHKYSLFVQFNNQMTVNGCTSSFKLSDKPVFILHSVLDEADTEMKDNVFMQVKNEHHL